MDKAIQLAVDNDLSGVDVQRICFDRYPVVLYEQLAEISDIDHVLGKNLGFILLFQK